MGKSAKELTSQLWTSLTTWLRDPGAAHHMGPGVDLLHPSRATLPVAEVLEPTQPPGDELTLNLPLIDRRYLPIRELGAGGFGNVYLVRDEDQDGQELALKVIHRKYCGSPEIEQRFRREIRILRRISHETVPQIYNDGKTEAGELYFTMQFFPGCNLRELLDRDGALAEDRVLRLALPIAESLAYAHKLNLVHRDLKPSNLQITRDENGREGIALLDFGIAGLLQGPENSSAHLTASTIGTPTYMAPERMRGKLATPAVDMYALGLVLHEMLTGRAPEFGSTPFEIAQAKLSGPRTVMGPFHASRGLSQLIGELIATEPEARPSADATVARLRAILSPQPPRPSRGRRAALAIAMVVLVAITAWSVWPRGGVQSPDPVALGSQETSTGSVPGLSLTKDVVKRNCDPGKAVATIEDFGVEARDESGGALSLEFSPGPGTFELGETTVTCTAQDEAGRTRQGTFRVVVTDTETPEIEFSVRDTVPCDPGKPFASVARPTAKDNSGAVPQLEIQPEGTEFSIGRHTLKCTATDGAGLTITEEFTFTVVDNEKPNIEPIGGTIEIPCRDGKTGVERDEVESRIKVTDNSGESVILKFDPPLHRLEGGHHAVRCTATDAFGNSHAVDYQVNVIPREEPLPKEVVAEQARNTPAPESHDNGSTIAPEGIPPDVASSDTSTPCEQGVRLAFFSPDSILVLCDQYGRSTRWRPKRTGRAGISVTSVETIRTGEGPVIIANVKSQLSEKVSVISRMVLVSGIYGSLPPECNSPFLIDQHEVGKNLWAAISPPFDRVVPPHLADTDEVELGVTFDNASEMASYFGKHLPTPEEWRTAALWSNGKYRALPWGDDFDLEHPMFLDKLRQPIDHAIKDVSSFGVAGAFSGAREWATSSDGGQSALFLMGPFWLHLIPPGVNTTHHDQFRINPDLYQRRLERASQPARFLSGDECRDASVRFVIRLEPSI